ncbi:conserved hypothetical protein [Histoplasma capsulatum G186AR]|uniref:Uncharacterized protein n=2 Tax=Ajellomyces capsulatus TaxID=5037 RepID=C0NG72_AJECG|nr:uncharacterized protein HCBG_01888 [Histoplasma capsulatum G186AR]EEH10243.1 conserved hypothetical protein [Histoplasma capsulatum G186AR]
MSLRAVYERFLADPAAASLSADAALNYIPTTTTFSHPEPIIKHLTTQSRVLKKKSEKIVHAIEGARSLCLDVETLLEFTTGGGAYLLDLDDNFLVDRVATVPIVHIVHFDSNDRITQIRLYWDQGALLKQLDVIGASSRNWPIRYTTEQSRLISSSVSAAARSSTSISSPASLADKRSITTAASNASFGSITSPSKRFTKDPHASLSLFQPYSPPPEERPVSAASRGSAKPPPRNYGDLFVGDDAESTPTKKSSHPARKDEVVPPKGGAGPTYKPSRLFADDEEEQRSEQVNTITSVKTNAKKYDHFEFGETPHPGSTMKPQAPGHFEFGEAEPPVSRSDQEKTKQENHFEFGEADPGSIQSNLPLRPHAKKHLSQWDFEDFVTPEKPRQKLQAQNVRHFSWSDDEGDTADSPPKQRRAPQPRRDAETHFELRDDGTPIARQQNQQMHPRGDAHNKGLGLYDNNLFDESGTPIANKQQGQQQQEQDQEHKAPFKVPGAAHNKGLGLYENNVYDDSGTPVKAAGTAAARISEAPQRPVSNIPANTVNRRKDFDSHWTMVDADADDFTNSNSVKKEGEKMNNSNNNHGRNANGNGNANGNSQQSHGAPLGFDRKKAVKMMDSSWDTFVEEEAEKEKEKEKLAPSVGVSGKRMSRDVNKRSWGFGDDGF